MEMASLSGEYTVKPITEADIPAVLRLQESNPLFFRHCPPPPTADAVREDMDALPPGKCPEDKYFAGFWQGNALVAVLDLVLGYPDSQTAFLGLLMLDAAYQGRGIGSRILEGVLQSLKPSFSFVRLGYAKGNPQSERFWHKNGFSPTGSITKAEAYDIIVMQRKL